MTERRGDHSFDAETRGVGALTMVENWNGFGIYEDDDDDDDDAEIRMEERLKGKYLWCRCVVDAGRKSSGQDTRVCRTRCSREKEFTDWH